MTDIYFSKLDPLLREHLKDTDIQSFSRLATTRLAQTALPHIHKLELVTSSAFAEAYDTLYTVSFPKRAERERTDLIITRLAQQYAGERPNLAPYRIVGIRDSTGAAIGGAQFSVLPLPGSAFAVPYLQYIYVRAANRKQDMSEVLHTLVLAVAAADAAALGRTVPFTMFETEPPGHGEDETARAYSKARVLIHGKTGGRALVLRRGKDGAILSPHVQPGLEKGDPPLCLMWVIRPAPLMDVTVDAGTLGSGLVAAYYQSLRDEGFPEENIRVAEEMVMGRCEGSVYELVSLNDASFGD